MVEVSHNLYDTLDVVRCPLSKVSSEILSPRQAIEGYGDLGWCDLCGKCGELFRYVEDKWVFNHDIRVTILGEADSYLVIPSLYRNIRCIWSKISRVLDHLSEYSISIAFLDGFQSLASSRGVELATEKLLEMGIRRVVALDRYVYKLRESLSVLPFSKLILKYLERGDVFLSPPDIPIFILKSIYSFYKSEESTYIKIFDRYVFDEISYSNFLVGFAFTPLHSEYMGFICKYLELRIPQKTVSVATVDPMVYISLDNCLKGRYVPVFIPSVVLDWIEDIRDL